MKVTLTTNTRVTAQCYDVLADSQAAGVSTNINNNDTQFEMHRDDEFEWQTPIYNKMNSGTKEYLAVSLTRT